MNERTNINQKAGIGSQTTQIGVQTNYYYQGKSKHYEYSLEDRIRKIYDSSVFPWFRSNLTYREAYPKLFIYPVLKSDSDTILYNELKSKVRDNLAITGVAGAGKSTLLRVFFAFHKHQGYKCIFLSARDIEYMSPFDFNEFRNELQIPRDTYVLFCIDDIDETYDQNNMWRRYQNLVTKMMNSPNCGFWLGCRSDFYERSGYSTQYGQKKYELCSWEKPQYDVFINIYKGIVKKPDLPEKVDNLLRLSPDLEKMKTNPFQLALLVFLAEENDERPIKGIYDLYERFMYQWFKHEQDHGRCNNTNHEMLSALHKIAKEIYDGEEFLFDEITMSNTGISELLIKDREDVIGRPIAKSFYHRSLAAFLLAHRVIEAMMSGDTNRLKEVLPYKLKDDVTNFIGDKYVYLSNRKKEVIKQTIQKLYYQTPETDDNLIIREQAIYFITRLGVDVKDFLEKIVRQDPQNRILRLTLAYGCVLSDSTVLREYALKYAESLYADSEDAVTNRAWTVVYFGDVLGEDPYTYKDQKKGSWQYARKARIKRFKCEKPRLKDFLFRLFDIPLFYSFLKDRGWNELSEDELGILENVSFPENVFRKGEVVFLEKVKRELVEDYRNHLKMQNITKDSVD